MMGQLGSFETFRHLGADFGLGSLHLRESLSHVGTSREIPSRPLFGVLPLARLIPQDVHSLMDYAGGAMCLGTTFVTEDRTAILAGVVLGASVVGVSALTDYRLGIAHVIPIEAHEVIDYVWGASCIAAPFLLGYAKRDPISALVHIATGLGTILASLCTDYRAAEGRGHSALGASAEPGPPVTETHFRVEP